jgi:hypothetical protein
MLRDVARESNRDAGRAPRIAARLGMTAICVWLLDSRAEICGSWACQRGDNLAASTA